MIINPNHSSVTNRNIGFYRPVFFLFNQWWNFIAIYKQWKASYLKMLKEIWFNSLNEWFLNGNLRAKRNPVKVRVKLVFMFWDSMAKAKTKTKTKSKSKLRLETMKSQLFFLRVSHISGVFHLYIETQRENPDNELSERTSERESNFIGNQQAAYFSWKCSTQQIQCIFFESELVKFDLLGAPCERYMLPK